VFKRLAAALLSRTKSERDPRQTVNEFRAQKRAEGLSEEAISALLVSARIQTEAFYMAQGYSDAGLNNLNWVYLLTNPPPPLPPEPLIWPSNWREQEARLQTWGASRDQIDEILRINGKQQWREMQVAANPGMALFMPRPHVEWWPGARLKTIARLDQEGYTEQEIRQILNARVTNSDYQRYPHLGEEGPIFLQYYGPKKAEARQRLHVVPPTQLRA
jgi:hypothetical protein